MEMYVYVMFYFIMCKVWNCIVIYVYIRNFVYYYLYFFINVFFYIWLYIFVVLLYFDYVVDFIM